MRPFGSTGMSRRSGAGIAIGRSRGRLKKRERGPTRQAVNAASSTTRPMVECCDQDACRMDVPVKLAARTVSGARSDDGAGVAMG